MAQYIKLFQKHQNLHLYALGRGNLSQIKVVKYPPPQNKTKHRFGHHKKAKTPKFFTIHKGKIIKNRKEAQ